MNNNDLSSFKAACKSLGLNEEMITEFYDFDGTIMFKYNGRNVSGTLYKDGSVQTLYFTDRYGMATQWLVEKGKIKSRLNDN